MYYERTIEATVRNVSATFPVLLLTGPRGDAQEAAHRLFSLLRQADEAGLETATWTCDSLELMEKLVRAGTKYITTNCITY